MAKAAGAGASRDGNAAYPTTASRAVRGSRLGRLFTYSKDAAFTAQENFTTEALALAITDDARPMLGAIQSLARRCVPPFDLLGANSLRPATQVYLAGGFLNLVLEVARDGVVIGEVWVEVKTGAPESGNQLDGYRSDALKSHRHTWVITLSGTPLRPDVPNVSWLELYRAVRGTPDEHPSWRDLRQFLEEQMLASDALGPVTDLEAAAIDGAFGLFQKASTVVVGAHKLIGEMFPSPRYEGLLWKSEETLLNGAATAFRKNGVFAGSSGPIRYGVMSDGGVAHWYLEISLAYTPAARVDSARSAAVALPNLWVRTAAGASLVTARQRVTGLPLPEDVLAWFKERLDEIVASGVVAAAMGVQAMGEAV